MSQWAAPLSVADSQLPRHDLLKLSLFFYAQALAGRLLSLVGLLQDLEVEAVETAFSSQFPTFPSDSGL